MSLIRPPVGGQGAIITFMPIALAASYAAVRLPHHEDDVVCGLIPNRIVFEPRSWNPLRIAVDFV